LKKFFKVLGIVGLTIVGLLGIVALYASDVELRVPVDLGGDGKVHLMVGTEGTSAPRELGSLTENGMRTRLTYPT
jgi:hypothetical protein